MTYRDCTQLANDPISERTLMNDKWDRRFLQLAKLIGSWSKNPGSRVGCCIVDPKRRIVSVGYTGFPAGVDDDPVRYADRPLKLRLSVHAEPNALLFAQRSCADCTAYIWPFPPCAQCAGLLIQAGIVRVVSPPLAEEKREHWAADMELAAMMFHEAGILLCEINEGDNR